MKPELAPKRRAGGAFDAWIAPALGYRRQLSELMLCSTLINLFGLALPLFSMVVYDRIVGNQAWESLWALAIGVSLAGGMELTLRLVRAYIVEHAGARWDQALDRRLFRSIAAMPLSAPPPVGVVLSRYRDLSASRDALSAQNLLTAADLPYLLFFAVIAFAVGGPLVLCGIVCALLFLFAMLAIHLVIKRNVRLQGRATTEKFQWVTEALVTAESMRGAVTHPRLAAGLGRASNQSARAMARLRFWQAAQYALLPFVMIMATVSTVVWGIYRIEEQALTLGGLIACVMLHGRMVSGVASISMLAEKLASFRTSYRQMRDTLAAAESVEAIAADAGAVAARPMGYRLRDVSFRHAQGNAVLSDVAIDIEPGWCVAVVGRSGAGKSTLLRLLAGRIETMSGTLHAGGYEVGRGASLLLAQWVAYKEQDPQFPSGTVADALHCAGPAYPDLIAGLLRVAGLAGMHHGQGGLPLNREIGPFGKGLSGGQRQLLGLARAISAERGTLVADEPTMGLDHVAQRAAIDALSRLRGKKTIVVATHQLELVRLADLILLVEGGKVVAQRPQEFFGGQDATEPHEKTANAAGIE